MSRGTPEDSMGTPRMSRRQLLIRATAAAVAIPSARANALSNTAHNQETAMTSKPFTKTAPPSWLLAFWKEIDDKTFGKGFDCFAEDAVANLGVSDWHGREAIRANPSRLHRHRFHGASRRSRVLGWRIAQGLPRHRDHEAG